MVGEIKININERLTEDNLGFILWKLESIEDFYPCYMAYQKRSVARR